MNMNVYMHSDHILFTIFAAVLYRIYNLSPSAQVCIIRYNTAAHVVNTTYSCNSRRFRCRPIMQHLIGDIADCGRKHLVTESRIVEPAKFNFHNSRLIADLTKAISNMERNGLHRTAYVF